MPNAPLVSVLLPVYNAENYLWGSTDSILIDQSWKDLELIIIDDGSSDTSAQIIDRLSDERVRVVQHSTNQGLIASLNEGLKLAKGRYIARMDADDVSLPERLARQVAYLEENKNAGIVGSAMELFGNSSGTTHVETESEKIKSKILFVTPFNHPTVMFRRSLVDDGHFYYDPGFPHAEDFELWSRLKDVTGFGNIDEPLLRYRTHAGQVTAVHDSTLETSVRKVLSGLLHGMVNFTPEELNLHMTLFRHDFSADKLDLTTCRDWLTKLVSCNAVSKTFSEVHFREACGRVWFLVCTSLAGKEKNTMEMYKSSFLAQAYNPPLSNRIKFHLKQWRKG